jgi:DNA-binding CsgD family transcriptional regulator
VSRARVTWVDRQRQVRELRLGGRAAPVQIGRSPRCDVCLDDASVSRHHVLLSPVGATWYAENVSAHGTLVDTAPLLGRHALRHGDRLRMGNVVVTYKDEDEEALTVTAPLTVHVPLTAKEREVLVALCRPVLERTGPPPSNEELARSLVLSVDGVRSHLRSIYAKLALVEGTATQRRAALVALAIEQGYVR